MKFQRNAPASDHIHHNVNALYLIPIAQYKTLLPTGGEKGRDGAIRKNFLHPTQLLLGQFGFNSGHQFLGIWLNA